MTSLVSSRKQRLLMLENVIRKNYEAFVTSGFALKEIRDDELYKEDDFESWDQYLRERVGKDFGIEASQVRRIILCAQVRTKLPDLIGTEGSNPDESGYSWSIKEVKEFARLAPKKDEPGQPYDMEKLDRRDVVRVAKKVIAEAEKLGTPVTSSLVRKVVDEELGVTRGKRAPEPEAEEDEEGNLKDYLFRYTGDIDGMREALEAIPQDTWTLLNRKRPNLVKRLIAVCERLAELLRKVES